MTNLSVVNATLLARASKLFGASPAGTIDEALRRMVSELETTAQMELPWSASPDQVLREAKSLVESQGGFTLDDLLDILYGDSPIFAPHQAKIRLGKILKANGYVRKQIRITRKNRPLWWTKL